MNKLALFVTVMFAAGIVTFQISESSPGDPAPFQESLAFDQKTREMIFIYECFKGSLTSATAGLAKGTLSLADAAAQVHDAAARYCPIYLERLRSSDPGQTSHGRVAHNLVGHVADLDGKNAPRPFRMKALQDELEAFIRESEEIDALATQSP